MFAALLDDTVTDLKDTKRSVSIMTSPLEFCKSVKSLAEVSAVFGGTVAASRYPKQCQKSAVVTVTGGFLQQALIFSCKGTETLKHHFENVQEYITKMNKLYYRGVPFGEDIAFQILMYTKGVLRHKKSAQFWRLGVYRMRHKSATKRKYKDLKKSKKEMKAIKALLKYLRSQDALVIGQRTKELTGIRVIPGGSVRIRVKGVNGGRPWSDCYNNLVVQA